MKTKFVAFLSDFGTADPFVSVMKGIVLSRAPKSTILDITHEIPAQDINMANFYLMASMNYMPHGTLFVCVVDPTVGTDRKIIWAKTKHYQFIAPDNTMISWAEQNEPFEEVRYVENKKLFLQNVSATFHGRDIIAPVAGEIANGLPEEEIGPVTTEYRQKTFPIPEHSGNRIKGEIIAIDHFGNAITNIRSGIYRENTVFSIADRLIHGTKSTYASVNSGEALALTGSFGFLEFAVRNGSFAKTYDIKVGTKLESLGTLDD